MTHGGRPPAPPGPLTAIVVHRRRPAACVRTMALLREQGVVEIVVVDNASPAEDRKAIIEADPNVVLLENADNLGFGPAANVGLRWWLAQPPHPPRQAGRDPNQASRDRPEGHEPAPRTRADAGPSERQAGTPEGSLAQSEDQQQRPSERRAGTPEGPHAQSEDQRDWVLLCPHDAEPAPGAIERMLAAATSRPDAGLACAEYGADARWSGRPHIDPYLGSTLAPTDHAPGWESCHHPHGTLMAARRACLEEVGLFDERYFAYGEEADLGERARRAGWDVGIVWGAVVRNPGMSSEVGVPEYLMLRNSMLLVRTHFGRYHAFMRFVMGVWVTARGAVGGRRTPFWHLRARLYALRDFPLGRFGPPPAKLSDAAPRTPG